MPSGEIDGYTPISVVPSAPPGAYAPTRSSITRSVKIDGYTPAPITRLSVQGTSSAPPPTYAGNKTPSITPSGAPLTYELKQEPTDIAPPAYESVFGPANAFIHRTTDMVTGKGMREAGGDGSPNKANSTSSPDHCCDVLCKFLCVNIIICGIPIVQLIWGLVNLNECPLAGGKILIYLILNGVVFILVGMRLWLPSQIDRCWLGIAVNIIAIVGIIFLIGWFIAGSVWVFKSYTAVEYERRDPSAEVMKRVKPNTEIKGPFKSNRFNVTTEFGTESEEFKVYWNSNKWHTITITNTISTCGTSFDNYADGKGYSQGGVWSFLVTEDILNIWFNDEEVLDLTKQEHADCYFWDAEIENIMFNDADGTYLLRFDDDELNEEMFGKDVYCNKAMYLFTFVILILIYIAIGAMSMVAFCL